MGKKNSLNIFFSIFYLFWLIPSGYHQFLFTFKFHSDDDSEEYSKWNNFVESIKSKLTVKQVVDGVRAGGQLSFDYLLLIVTAE